MVLAGLGVFPLAAFIKWAPVVKWLPMAGAEWAVSMLVVGVLCFALARYAGERVDAFLDNAKTSIMSATPRDFAIYIGLVTVFAALFVAWFCFGGLPTGGDEMAQRFQARLLVAATARRLVASTWTEMPRALRCTSSALR